MHSPPLAVDSYLLNDIIGHYISNDMFRVGEKDLVYMDMDFGRILKLPYRGTRVDIREFDKHHNTFYDKRLHRYGLSR